MDLIKFAPNSICHVRSLKRLTLHSSPWMSSSRSLGHSSCSSLPRRFSATARVDSQSSAADSTSYNLYQYKICPFSNIAKAVLKYQKIPFRTVEVNPLTKAELKFSKDYRKVPIVLRVGSSQDPSQQSPTEQFNGTEEILAHFASRRGDDDSNFASSTSSQRWQDFAKSKLAPLLYPNLCRTLSSSFRAFGYVHGVDSPFTTVQRYSIQYAGSLAMYFAASKIKKKYNIGDVRLALDDALEELEAGLASGDSCNVHDEDVKFLRQLDSSSPSPVARPHLGDLAVFGVLKGLEGLPIFEEIVEDSRFSQIQKWYSAMDELVNNDKK